MTKDSNKDKDLHRELDDHFSDPQRKKLVESLDSILGRKELRKKERFNRKSILYIPLAAAFVVCVIYLVFQLNRNDNVVSESGIVATSEDTAQQNSPTKTTDAVEEEITKIKEQKGKEQQQEVNNELESEPRYYVKNEKQRFKPNAQMETLTQSSMRGEGIELAFTRTILNRYQITGTHNQISLEIEGSVASVNKISELRIAIYNNTNVNEPLLEIWVPVLTDNLGQQKFALKKQLSLDYGLYYYIYESEAGGIIQGGHFRVEQIP